MGCRKISCDIRYSVYKINRDDQVKRMYRYTNYYQSIGRENRNRERGIQDAVFQKAKNGVKASVLADGAGSAKLAAIGSRAISRGICEYMFDEVDGFMEAPVEIVRYNVALEIERILGGLTKDFERERDAFSSTLVGAVFDLGRNMFCTVHLGDGMILSDSGKEYIPLSYPRSGMCSRKTYLTTSEKVMERMQIYRGTLDGIKGMVLISDGVYELPFRASMLGKKLRDIKAGIADLDTADDDQSIVFMDKVS